MSGGFDPAPRHFGGSAGQLSEVLLDALLEANGSAVTTEQASYAYAECFAESRCLTYLWELNQRLANQWDPVRMTDFLARWESIYETKPLSTDTPNDRRAKIAAKLAAYGLPATQQVVTDLLSVVLGEVFVGVVLTPSTIALGQCPGGATLPGGVTLADGPWYSTIAHLAVETIQPAGMPDTTYYETVGQVRAYLDNLIAAWCSVDWFKDGVHGPGFFLDETNLDVERFDGP